MKAPYLLLALGACTDSCSCKSDVDSPADSSIDSPPADSEAHSDCDSGYCCPAVNDFDCSGLGEPADDTAQMYYDQCAGRLGEPIEVRELLAAVGCAPDVPDGELHVYHDATILDVLQEAGFFDDGHLPEVDLDSEQLVLLNSWGDGEDCSGGGQEELVEGFFVDPDADGAMLARVNHDQLCEPPDCGALPHVYLWATPRLEVAACRYGVCCR